MTIDEAIKAAVGHDTILRTCWECNSAHEHLREANYPLLCFACGKTYWKGLCIHQEEAPK